MGVLSPQEDNAAFSGGHSRQGPGWPEQQGPGPLKRQETLEVQETVWPAAREGMGEAGMLTAQRSIE